MHATFINNMLDNNFIKKSGKIADLLILIGVIAIVGGIAMFSTSLIMIMGGKNISYVIGLGIAFVFRIIDMEVLDKLYPDYGICQLTGTKLKLYTFYDKYVPYAHCSGTPRWEMSSCVIGSVALIVISLIIGMIAFEKKEIK